MNRYRRCTRFAGVCMVPAMVLTACEEETTSSLPAPTVSTMLVNGDQQSARVGERLPQDLSVSFRTTGGTTLLDVPIAISVVDGDGGMRIPGRGSVSGNNSTLQSSTGPSGVIDVEVTLGPRTGSHVFRLASPLGTLTDSVRLIYATALPGPVATVLRSGDAQVGLPGEPLPFPPAIIVQDRFGNPVPDVEVVWSITAGEGAVDPDRSTSDSEGAARTTWTLGTAQGSHALDATIESIGRFRFQATATNAAPARAVPAGPLRLLPRLR